MALEKFYPSNKSYDLTATIASGQQESEVINVYGKEIAGIFIPSTFDGTTLTFKSASAIDGTYVTVQDGDGNDFTITTTAGKYAPVKNLAIIAGLQFLKLVAGTAQSTTDTVFTLALRPV